MAILKHGEIDDSAEYYALTLTSDGKKANWSAYSHFAGFQDDNRGIELREASLVHPRIMAENWASIGQPAMAVNTDKDLAVLLVNGGNALVRADLAKRLLPEVLVPFPTVREQRHGGFTANEANIMKARRRFPTQKQRMEILRRDNYRCRICGRNADDALDLRLHTHHIHEYAEGGPTFNWNLITLCQTCHDGVTPVERWELEARIAGEDPPAEVKEEQERYLAGVRLYRKLVKDVLSKRDRSKKKKESSAKTKG